MLQDIRKSSQGTAAKIIIGLIVISFAAFGIESILLGGGGGGVAEVNGEEISAQELQMAAFNQTRRIINSMGENYDPSLINEDQIQAQALESLINRRVLTQAADDLRLAVSEAEIGSVVGEMEQFQIDGRFDPERYKVLLSENGYTPASFKRSLSDDLLLTQVRSGIAGSNFVTTAEVDLGARIVGEQRDFRYLTIPGDGLDVPDEVSPSEIDAFYTANQARFMTEESVDLDYIELSLDQYREPVSDEAIEAAFEETLAEFESLTENRVSHILITSEGEGSVDERVAAAQAQLQAGTPFAEVAETLSQDIATARRGGDLGYSSGDAFPESMEEAIAALQPGELAPPVETDAGTHLILLTERRQSEAPSLLEMRPQLELALQEDAAREGLLQDVEALRDLSFNADDLASPARELDLEVRQALAVRRDLGEGVFAQSALRDAAFADDVLGEGHNSEVIELAGNQFVVLRVNQYNQPSVRPLDEVRQSIVDSVQADRLRAAVTAEAESVLDALRSGQAMDELAKERGYEWQVELGASRTSFAVDAAVLGQAFLMPAPQGNSVADFRLSDANDAIVVELTRVQPGSYESLDEEARFQLERQLANESVQLMDVEYQQAVRGAADINVM